MIETLFFRGGLDFSDKTSRNNAWRRFDPSAPWSKTNHAWRIFLGAFQTDEDVNGVYKVRQIVSRFTWESPQTALGYFYSHYRNLTGGVTSVEYYHGATVVDYDDKSTDYWGVTLGSFINTYNKDENQYLVQHEFGHTLQSLYLGVFYLPIVGLPSAIGCLLQDKYPSVFDHNHEWYEISANRLSYDYLEWYHPSEMASLPWNTSEYPISYTLDPSFFASIFLSLIVIRLLAII